MDLRLLDTDQIGKKEKFVRSWKKRRIKNYTKMNLQERQKEQEHDNRISYQRAQDRVTELKAFYTHLVTFLIINPFLIYINYVTYWGYQWFWFVLMGWGIGLIAHGLTVFSFGSNWESRKIREIMAKEEEEELRIEDK